MKTSRFSFSSLVLISPAENNSTANILLVWKGPFGFILTTAIHNCSQMQQTTGCTNLDLFTLIVTLFSLPLLVRALQIVSHLRDPTEVLEFTFSTSFRECEYVTCWLQN